MLDRNAVAQAMEDLAVNLAVECGHESIYCPVTDVWAPSDADIAHALREPVGMGAVLMDLCRMLRIDPPQVVSLAMDERRIQTP